jgi:hypothetical protein
LRRLLPDADRFVEGYKLALDKQGVLRAVTVRFHRFVPRDAFKTASLEALEQRWGKPRAGADRNADILTVSNPKRGVFGTVQRTWSNDHWEITQDLPASR